MNVSDVYFVFCHNDDAFFIYSKWHASNLLYGCESSDVANTFNSTSYYVDNACSQVHGHDPKISVYYVLVSRKS